MNVLRMLVVAVAVASICSTAGAQAFTEDFESYAAGTDLQNVGGWKGWDNTPGASAPVSDAFAYSGANSVEIVPSADLVHEFDIAGGKWVFSTMMYIPSGTSGTSYFILLNSYDDGANQDWSVQTLLDLGAGTLSSYYVAGSQADIIYDEWIELKLVIDLDENTVDEFYNGVEFASHQWDDTEHDTIGAVDLFGNNASSIYYDDIMIQSYIMTLAAASAPSPANAEDDARRDVVLEWNPGVFAATHDVYFGTDFDAVTTADRGNPMDVLLSEGQATTTFDPEGLLEFGQTYYWRVDEVNAAPDNTIFKGSVWTLTAEPFVYPIENITVTSNTTPEGNAIPENTINGSGLNENDEHSRDDDAMWLGTPGDEPAYGGVLRGRRGLDGSGRRDLSPGNVQVRLCRQHHHRLCRRRRQVRPVDRQQWLQHDRQVRAQRSPVPLRPRPCPRAPTDRRGDRGGHQYHADLAGGARSRFA